MTETKDIFEKLPKIHFITLGDGTKGVSFTLKEWNQLKSEIQEIADKNKLEVKPYDEKLAKKVADMVFSFVHKHITGFTLTQEKRVKDDIIQAVNKEIFLYSDYEEDVGKLKKEIKILKKDQKFDWKDHATYEKNWRKRLEIENIKLKKDIERLNKEVDKWWTEFLYWSNEVIDVQLESNQLKQQNQELQHSLDLALKELNKRS